MKLTLVTDSNRSSVLQSFENNNIGVDTETTGKGFPDLPFVLTVAKGDEVFYFDLGRDSAHTPFTVRGSLIFSHNLKFDLMMLAKVGIALEGELWCTLVTERLLRNDLMDYSLETTAKKYGYKKDDRAMAYIKEHGLYEKRVFKGEVMDKVPMFYKIPKEILMEYAGQDAFLHLKVGEAQVAKLRESP
jgi:hypothetical protein